MNIKDIKWDTKRAEPLDHSESDEISLIYWIAENFWRKSYMTQREFSGVTLLRKADNQYVTTLHKSSFPKKFTYNEQGVLQPMAQFASHANLPDGDREAKQYVLVNYWHTHFDFIINETDSAGTKRRKHEQDQLRRNDCWAQPDLGVVAGMKLKLEELAKKNPNIQPKIFSAYIITPQLILPFRPGIRHPFPAPLPWPKQTARQ